MWSFPPIEDTKLDFTPARLGEPAVESVYKIDPELFVSDRVRVSYYVRSADLAAARETGEAPTFECAGPREKIFFDPAELVCGIVTCGGLCPGLNDVIRTITLTLRWEYGVRKVLGFRFGYQGLSENPLEQPIELTPESVDAIQHLGGTILGSSRGHQEPAEMVATLRRHNIRLLFVIGGDGTFAGAHAIWQECERQGQKIAIIGIPKTIVRLRHRRGGGPQGARTRPRGSQGVMERGEPGQADGPGFRVHCRRGDDCQRRREFLPHP